MPDLTMLAEAVQELAVNVGDLKTELHAESERTRAQQRQVSAKTQSSARRVAALILLPVLFVAAGVITAVVQNSDLKSVQDSQLEETKELERINRRVEECTTPPEPGSPESRDPDYCGNRSRGSTAKLVETIHVTIVASDICVTEGTPGVECVQRKFPEVQAAIDEVTAAAGG
jgi:hypothetical protein